MVRCQFWLSQPQLLPMVMHGVLSCQTSQVRQVGTHVVVPGTHAWQVVFER